MMSDAPEKPARRRRYQGSHPRTFHEKYKELNPARYTDEARKILAAGKTPAGTHRPIMVEEILEVLAPQPGDFAVDATLGYGGHAAALLDRVLPGGRVLALDVDPIELPKAEARLRARDLPDDALTVRRSNFAGLAGLLAADGLPPADVVLADLGLSSMQIDDPSRGFSFKRAGPLDLRMNPRRGQPAALLLATLEASTLARLLEANADEPHAAAVAHAVLERQQRTPITTTTDLADTVAHAILGQYGTEEAERAIRRVFQALRVAVNDEFGALDAFLRVLPGCLKPGGRVAILTFHSGEDRRVKQAFKAGLRSGAFGAVAHDVVRPGSDERRANPRASAAKLRWAVRR
jgi:16S rRNA (cytosine1402-N4)-methyltransferase